MSRFYSYLYGIETAKGFELIGQNLWFYSYLYGIETSVIQYFTSPEYGFYSYLYGIETELCGHHIGQRQGFTRTFMELKLDTLVSRDPPAPVLLVPLWNWNMTIHDIIEPLESFTRTFMELKRRIMRTRRSRYSSFTRTFMELKLCCV